MKKDFIQHCANKWGALAADIFTKKHHSHEPKESSVFLYKNPDPVCVAVPL